MNENENYNMGQSGAVNTIPQFAPFAHLNEREVLAVAESAIHFLGLYVPEMRDRKAVDDAREAAYRLQMAITELERRMTRKIAA